MSILSLHTASRPALQRGLKALLPAFVLASAFAMPELQAQPIPVGDIREDLYRLRQLRADSLPSTSLTNRPLWMHTYRRGLPGEAEDGAPWWRQAMELPSLYRIDGGFLGEITAGAWEPVVTAAYNSRLPHGENNGAAWYGAGHNTRLQAGGWITSDYITLSLRPHYHYRQNKDFPAPRFLPVYPDSGIRYVAPGILPEDSLAEAIDRPFRFGPNAYGEWDLGESSLRLHYRHLEIGVGSEALWWGPALNYPLVMSNNAGGFKHAFLGTREPVPLPWELGHLEFRWIWARPEDSDYFDLNLEDAPNEINRGERKALTTTGRFMNGLNVAWSPGFLPGFTLGISRVIHQYMPSDILGLSDPGPLNWRDDFSAIFKPFPQQDPEAYLQGSDGDAAAYQKVNGLASVWARWVFPESGAEIYGEFYKEDHNWNLRDLLTQPQHARAWTVGGQKIFDPGWEPVDFLRVRGEFNSLLGGQIDDVRPQLYLYSHTNVKQGHTHRGQVLGAAIGPGSTSQFVAMDAWFDRGRLGLFLQRVAENDHFHYEYNQRYFTEGGFKDQNRHRVNLNIGLEGAWRKGPLLLEAQAVWNKQFNYGRYDYGVLVEGYGDASYGTHIVNLHLNLKLRYLF